MARTTLQLELCEPSSVELLQFKLRPPPEAFCIATPMPVNHRGAIDEHECFVSKVFTIASRFHSASAFLPWVHTPSRFRFGGFHPAPWRAFQFRLRKLRRTGRGFIQ